MPEELGLESISGVLGGGAAGVVSFWLWMILTKRLPSPGESEFKDQEIAKRDKTIAEKDLYIKELVQDLQERNEAITNDVMPAFTQVVTELLRNQSGR